MSIIYHLCFSSVISGTLGIILNSSVTCRDGFDTLIDHAPEKLHFVKQVTHLIQTSQITYIQQSFVLPKFLSVEESSMKMAKSRLKKVKARACHRENVKS